MALNSAEYLDSEEEISVTDDYLTASEKPFVISSNINQEKFVDVTFSHEMNLKKFHFNFEEESFINGPKFRSKFTKSNEPSMVLGNSSDSVHLIKKFEGFYEEMKARLKSLKNIPIMKPKSPLVAPNSGQESISSHESEMLFKNLKNTPAVQEQLKFIQKLDDEIESVISDYKSEREQRLETQLELCNDICKHSVLPQKDTHSFLDMCHFEFSDPGENEQYSIDDQVNEDIDEILPNTLESRTKNFIRNYPSTFINRNIEVAKTGSLAGSSLTDEEKSRIELLLETNIPHSKEESSENLTESCATDLEIMSCDPLNAYNFFDGERDKLVDIDEKLEKFTEDEKETEKSERNSKISLDFEDEFRLKKALKRINEQIKELHSRDEKEKEYMKEINLDNLTGDIEEDVKVLIDGDDELLYEKEMDEINKRIKELSDGAYKNKLVNENECKVDEVSVYDSVENKENCIEGTLDENEYWKPNTDLFLKKVEKNQSENEED